MAGATAALFAARHGINTMLLTSGLPGGQLLNITRIEDFPGFPGAVSGFELGPAVQEQALDAGAQVQVAEVVSTRAVTDGWSVTTTSDELTARVVVAASGTAARRLGIPGESNLTGRGVSACASCDGPLHAGEVVAVVGGGDSAFQEALELAGLVAEVRLFHRGPDPIAQHSYVERVRAIDNVFVRPHSEVSEISGTDRVEAIRVRDTDTGADETVEVAAVFVYVGATPHAPYLPEAIDRDTAGHVITDTSMRTNVPGAFAVGSLRRDSAGQAITAAGDGATAARAAHRYLASGAWPLHAPIRATST
jgi:thioredoxin reductase (NADPH)